MNKIQTVYQSLISTIQSLTPIHDDQIQNIKSILRLKSYRKGEHFLLADQIPRQIGFNSKGLFRYYYIDRDGNDFTKGFVIENRFIVSYSAMVQDRESFFSVEALEDSQIIILDYSDFQNLLKLHPCWINLLKDLIEQAFILKEKREKEFLLDDAQTRYLSFLKDYPGLTNRVKQYLIASYLGITPVALSRIKKKINPINLG